MDPRSTPHHPFPRPLSEHSLRDSRSVPLPPPPYTLQAPIRQSHPTLTNDPFLPRRNERSDPRQAPGQTLPQSPFSLEKYAASLSREAPASAMMLANGQQQTLRDSDGAWRSADRGVDGSMHRNIHGMCYFSCVRNVSWSIRSYSSSASWFVYYMLNVADYVATATYWRPVTSQVSLRVTAECSQSMKFRTLPLGVAAVSSPACFLRNLRLTLAFVFIYEGAPLLSCIPTNMSGQETK